MHATQGFLTLIQYIHHMWSVSHLFWCHDPGINKTTHHLSKLPQTSPNVTSGGREGGAFHLCMHILLVLLIWYVLIRFYPESFEVTLGCGMWWLAWDQISLTSSTIHTTRAELSHNLVHVSKVAVQFWYFILYRNLEDGGRNNILVYIMIPSAQKQ